MGRVVEGFLSCTLSLSMGMQQSQVTDELIGVDQKVPDWLIKMVFWGEPETSVRSSIKSGLGVRLSARVTPVVLPAWPRQRGTPQKAKAWLQSFVPPFKNTGLLF